MSKIIAKVNALEISSDELDEMVTSYQQQTGADVVSDDERKMLLENIIENRLLREESHARGLKVTDELLNQQLDYFYEQYGGKEHLTAMLKQHNMSIDDIIGNMREDLQGQLTARDEIAKKLDISESDLNEFYQINKEAIKTEESYRASHILFSEEGGRALGEKVLAEIRNGGDFASLAKAHSSCPSKENGGDLNVFGKGRMVPEFENAVVAMKVNDVSDLVKTQFGYHIIKKTGHVEGKQLSFDEAKDQIKNILTQDKSEEIIRALIDSLRKKFVVQYL